MKTLVLGLGNELYGDDGIGIHVIRHLKKELEAVKEASPWLENVDFEEKDLRHIPGPSPHYVSVPQTLEIGKKLGLKVPSKIKIIAVEAKNMYNLGEGLSEEMTKAILSITRKEK